jgi:phosphate transport system substrate-binding protein
MKQKEFVKRRMGFFIVFLFFISFLSQTPAVTGEVLKIGGTGSILGTMRHLGKSFEKTDPGITVQVFPSLGSSGGIKAVSKGAIDIGVSAFPLNEEERKLDLSGFEFAKSPLVLITRNGVGISGLSTDQLIKIYRGETQAWPDGERLRLVLRPASDSDTLLIKNISLETKKAVECALARPGMLLALTDQDCLDTFEMTPGAFTFSTLTQILTEKRSPKMLTYNGVKPSLQTLSDRSYPLYKPFFIVTRPEPPDRAKKFLSFIQSPKGKKILEESGNLLTAGSHGK